MVAFTVWGLGALFYLMGFYHRVAPAVITEDLMRSFSINAAALGNMSAFYFYSYVAMQIPTGILADRWGPRKLLTTGAFIAGIGTLVFAVAGDVMWANLGRLLIGGSVAVAFVSILKLGGDWFPAEKFALIPGWAVFFGIIGAVSAGVPLRLLVDAFDWRMVIGGSAVITLAIGVAIWIVIRDTPAERGYANFESPTSEFKEDQSEGIVSGLAKALKYRNVWLHFLIPGGVVGCVLTFSGLWGVPFLTTHYQMTTKTASFLTSAMMIAWAVAGPLFGALSNRLGKRKIVYLGALIGLIFCWGIILLGPILPFPLLVVLLLLAGVFSGCMTLFPHCQRVGSAQSDRYGNRFYQYGRHVRSHGFAACSGFDDGSLLAGGDAKRGQDLWDGGLSRRIFTDDRLVGFIYSADLFCSRDRASCCEERLDGLRLCHQIRSALNPSG